MRIIKLKLIELQENNADSRKIESQKLTKC